MRRAGGRPARAVAGSVAVVCLAALCLTALHLAGALAWPGRPARPPAGPHPRGTAGREAPPVGSRAPAAGGLVPDTARRPPSGTAGTYRVGLVRFRFVEPARVGPTGQRLGPRLLLTVVRYPAPGPGRGAGRTSGAPAGARPRPAAGPFPLIVFGPGFQQCDTRYAGLLKYWASAGYVVAAVNFPRSDCLTGSAATEADLVNQPGDMSFEITRLLAASGGRHGVLARLINPRQVAVAGQSDGGDTTAAIAAGSCCADRRVRAAAVLSGAEWAPLPGRYFGGRTPPMLFVQGSADVINPPAVSLLMYLADRSAARYYLDLFGIGHMTPYSGVNRIERITAKVTLAFFDRWVLGQRGAWHAMKAAGTVRRSAALVAGGVRPPR